MRLDGRLDQITAPAVKQRLSLLIHMGHPRMIVDLSKVTALDRDGIRILHDEWQEAQKVGGDLCLLLLGEQVQRVQDATYDQTSPDMYSNIGEAMHHLKNHTVPYSYSL